MASDPLEWSTSFFNRNSNHQPVLKAATLKMCVQPHNVHSFQALQANVIHTWCLATGQLLNHSWSVEFLLHRGFVVGLCVGSFYHPTLSPVRVSCEHPEHGPASTACQNFVEVSQRFFSLDTPNTSNTQVFTIYLFLFILNKYII